MGKELLGQDVLRLDDLFKVGSDVSVIITSNDTNFEIKLIVNVYAELFKFNECILLIWNEKEVSMYASDSHQIY